MKETKRRLAMVVAMVMAIVYLTYRGVYTLNLDSIYGGIASLSLYLAECYGCFLMFLYFFQIWEVKNPEPVPPLPDRTVDVFIPTYNEDPDLLRGTIGAALKIDYPHKTYVLDDGKRPEVKALCEELGAEYVVRPSNMHAKAGNLNHALEMTDGEFLIIFDADHVAERNFIDRLIGYFADERLGFIQTPHSFYNFDAYQGVLDYEKGVYWEEGMLFYNVTQPGKNRWNGVSFCGSAAMFRREALAEVNLVATESITEDMHTGMRMHAKGWNSLFVNERLIAAQAAPDITSFNTQRLRWGEGNLGIIAFDNPLTIKGLTFAQRLCYLGSMLSWTTGVQKLVIYAAPVLMLLTGIPPVVNLSWTLALLTFTYMIAVWVGVKVSSNGYGKLFAIELTQMACFWTQVKGTWRAIFNRKKANFVVTSKRGRQSNSLLKHVAPQLAYILASVVAITWAGMRYVLHLSDDLVGLSIGSALLVFHSWLAWVVIRRALKPGDQRYSWRHPAAFHVAYEIQDSLGDLISGVGVTRDLNERGMGLITFEELPETADIKVTVSAGDRQVCCPAQIRWRKTLVQFNSRRDGYTQAYRYGLQFGELDTQQLDSLWWMGAQYAVARQYEKFEGGQFGIDPSDIPKLPQVKDEHRQQLPVIVDLWEDATVPVVTETIGSETFTAILPTATPKDLATELQMLTPFGPVRGWATVEELQRRQIAGADLYETRFRFRRFMEESRGKMTSALGHADTKALSPVMRLKPEIQPLPLSRPAAMITGFSSAAAILVAGSALLFQQDEAAIASVNHGAEPSEKQVARLNHLVEEISQSEKVNEEKVLRLRSAMRKIGREDQVQVLDRILAKHATTSLHGQLLKAVSLQNLGQVNEAEAIFGELIHRLDELHDDKTRAEALLAAARNSANMNDYQLARIRYEKYWQLDYQREIARKEFAGVLSRLNDTERAIELLEGENRTRSERHLLATIYASKARFHDAVSVYRSLLLEDPADRVATEGLANNYFWAKQYEEAIPVYRDLLQTSPENTNYREKLAKALFWGEHYQEAFPLYKELVQSHPEQMSAWEGYLLSATKIPRLQPHETALINSVYERRDEYQNHPEFLVVLLAAADHIKNERMGLTLMEELLARYPNDAELRLRFADTLQAMGKYKEAEENYQWLLRDSENASIETTQALPSRDRETR